MNDVPEYLRFNLRRVANEEVTDMAEASEDGDFKQLRKIRQINRPVEAADRTQSTNENGNSNTSSSFDKGFLPRTLSSKSDQTMETLRTELFSIAVNGNMEDISRKIEKVINIVPLSDFVMLDPENGSSVLNIALEKKRLEVAKLIVLKGDEALIHSEFITGKSKKTALHQITEMNAIELAQTILSKVEDVHKAIMTTTSIDISGQRPRELTCLHLAAFHGYTKLVDLYLTVGRNHGIHVDLKNQKQDTPLLWAARWGHYETVNYLLNENANPNEVNDKGSTAFYWAVRYEHVDVVRLLIENLKQQVNVSKERKLGLVAPIVLAAALGNNEIVNLLLDHGANTNHRIPGGGVPLHYAAEEGNFDVVTTLLCRNADIKLHDEKGDSALLKAARNGYACVVRKLIVHGDDPYYKNHIGHDVWFYAIIQKDNAVIDCLLDSVEVRSSENRSPLFVAANLGNCQKLRYLLKAGIDPEIKDEFGNNFLHIAVLSDRKEIINEFHKIVDVNVKNNAGETCLHLAIKLGHTEITKMLLSIKAKTNIKNNKGETVLHIAAMSPFMTPDLAKQIMDYTIQTHDWESLNATDSAGNNALHLATKYAEPDVLWEFRFLRFKDVDSKGNTPLHYAVRKEDPESLETMLDIFESMQRDGNIDQSNGDMKTVLHLAAESGLSNAITRLIHLHAQLDTQDKHGNTILHNLVLSVVKDSRNAQRYMEVFQTIVNVCPIWCQLSSRFTHGTGTDKVEIMKRQRRQALFWLMLEVQNKDNLSVLAVACKYGAHEILATYFQLQDVSVFREKENPNTVWFDITGITPETTESVTKKYFKSSNINDISPNVCSLDLLISLPDKARAAAVLDIPPMREIENMYNMINLVVYAVIILMHIAYMSVFTFVGISISQSFGEGNTVFPKSDAVYIASYVIVPTEPVIILLFVLMNICTALKRRDFSGNLRTVLPYVFYLLYPGAIFTWIILISIYERYQDYVLATSLCLGWLFTVNFTQGFRALHYFWRMLLNMVARDTSRFIIVYFFVLLAFASSLHSLFQISKDISDTYSSPFDTMFLVFNLMVGIGEVFDDNFETGMSNVGRTSTFTKVIYIVYIVLATIILLNMLIAMMNDSYADILKMQTVNWRLDSVDRGVYIERLLPWTRTLITNIVNRRIPGEEPNYKVTKNFLKLPEEKYEKYMEEFLQRGKTNDSFNLEFQERLRKLELGIKRTDEHITNAEIKLERIHNMITKQGES